MDRPEGRLGAGAKTPILRAFEVPNCFFRCSVSGVGNLQEPNGRVDVFLVEFVLLYRVPT